MVDRWQPSRAGLIALWRYWDETFTFHNGRLLLRGPNGSGKSMALELLLPFLLDGDTSPAKLTSSGRLRGRMFDRLMTGTSEQTRTGYAWIEFRRGPDVFTVGARVRGSHATKKTDVDLFTTTLAVGRDLHLLDATRTPLSRKALIEAIGNTGRVHGSADEHREAVRETLFPGFSSERYESVIGALLALRKEKLSEKLDPDKLSSVLSDALPPLDEHDIAAVAEGFERLDRRRDALAELERDVGDVRQLAQRQRAYADVVVASAATSVRSAESARDTVTRNERIARDQLLDVEAREAQARGERDRLTSRSEELEVEIAALKDSDAYRAGAGLTDLRAQATQLRAVAERESTRAADTAARLEDALRTADRAAEAQAAAQLNAERARDELGTVADSVGAEQVVVEAARAEDVDAGEKLLSAWIRAQRARVGEVRARLRSHDKAVTQRGVHEEQVSAAEQLCAERDATVSAAVHAEADQREQYAAAVQAWSANCDTVGRARLQAALPTPADDPESVSAAVAELRRMLAAEDATAGERLAAERHAADEELVGWRSERARWESSELVAPDGPSWRTDRDSTAGAPLWRLVDVAPGVPDDAIDGIESALTASGLVDAWVRPDGGVELGPEQSDVQLAARPFDGRTLGALLTPAADTAAIPAATVDSVLASIAIVDTALPDADGRTGGDHVALGLDGSYRLGSAFGRGPRRSALLLGAVARERHRLQRLREIDAAIGEVQRRLDAVARQESALEQRRAAVVAELADQPSGSGVADAVRAVTESRIRRIEADDAAERARAALRSAEDAVRSALRELITLATRHGLPTDAATLDGVDVALARLVEVTGVWARRCRELVTAARQRTVADSTAERASDDAERSEAAVADAERTAAELERRVETLEVSVGADYRQILDQIQALGHDRDTARNKIKSLAAEVDSMRERLGGLREKVTSAEDARAQAEAARDDAHRLLVAVLAAVGADAGVPPDAPLDTATAVLAIARSLGARYEKLDCSEQAIEHRSAQVAERLHLARAALGPRADFDRELINAGCWVLRTTAGGIRRRVGELVEALTAQLAEGRAELAAEEERLFEQTLAGSVRRALAHRIRQATGLVDGINRQLAAVRTAAAGVGVQLRWEVDPDQPAAVQAARSLLLRDPADLSEAERGALQEFVRARVDQARAELEVNAPWEARLRESLDYRAWHRFSLQLAHRDWSGYVPATGPRLQRLSTGERSIALHLPMIASVAAHYADDDGSPAKCPRLILLDELFAGVDAANRAQLFGAFTTWQLDAVFTSDHEWCQYADLDGIAIHYLHPPTNDDPVTSTRFTWDGSCRRIDPAVA